MVPSQRSYQSVGYAVDKADCRAKHIMVYRNKAFFRLLARVFHFLDSIWLQLAV